LNFFETILSYVGNGAEAVFAMFGKVLGGPISLFWASPDGTAPEEITILGEILLLSAIVGIALFAMKWIRSMIPFLR